MVNFMIPGKHKCQGLTLNYMINPFKFMASIAVIIINPLLYSKLSSILGKPVRLR